LLVNPRTPIIEMKLQHGSFIPLSSSAQKSLIQSANLNLSEARDFAAIKEMSPQKARSKSANSQIIPRHTIRERSSNSGSPPS
jgi:hypothetical protein